MKIMELSGLELHCLIEDINQKLNQGYYVGSYIQYFKKFIFPENAPS